MTSPRAGSLSQAQAAPLTRLRLPGCGDCMILIRPAPRIPAGGGDARVGRGPATAADGAVDTGVFGRRRGVSAGLPPAAGTRSFAVSRTSRDPACTAAVAKLPRVTLAFW